jgi:hypothetical protein
VETKVCKKCNTEKDICEFYNSKTSKDGKRNSCKECESIEYKKWKKNNKDKVKLQKQRYYTKYPQKKTDKNKKYGEKYKQREYIRKRKWREDNPEYVSIYYQNNKDKINKKYSIKKKDDPIFKLQSHYRSKLNKILGAKKTKRTFNIIGCTAQQLKEHLENQFIDGMSWDNHGLYGWHIDHIIPLSSAKTEDELYKLCHYTNLQPLWAKDNLKKSNKLDYLLENK